MAMHLKTAYIWSCTFIFARQDGPSNSWSLRVRYPSFYISIAIEANVPRVEIFILLSTKNTTVMRIWTFLRLWGAKKYEKTYDPGGTRTQNPPFGGPNGLLIELAT